MHWATNTDGDWVRPKGEYLAKVTRLHGAGFTRKPFWSVGGNRRFASGFRESVPKAKAAADKALAEFLAQDAQGKLAI